MSKNPSTVCLKTKGQERSLCGTVRQLKIERENERWVQRDDWLRSSHLPHSLLSLFISLIVAVSAGELSDDNHELFQKVFLNSGSPERTVEHLQQFLKHNLRHLSRLQDVWMVFLTDSHSHYFSVESPETRSNLWTYSSISSTVRSYFLSQLLFLFVSGWEIKEKDERKLIEKSMIQHLMSDGNSWK